MDNFGGYCEFKEIFEVNNIDSILAGFILS